MASNVVSNWNPRGEFASCLPAPKRHALPTALSSLPVVRKGGLNLSENLPPEVAEAHWNKTRNLMVFTLAIWAFFSFFIHMFVTALNNIVILGFPLGFYMAAQGSLIVFVVLIFWFSNRQNKIDEEFGVAED